MKSVTKWTNRKAGCQSPLGCLPAWKASANSDDSTISNLKLFASPAGLGWEARVPMDLNDNGLVVVWYACDTGYPGKNACDSKTLDTASQDANWGVWWVLNGISGRVRPEDVLDKENGKQYAFKSALQSSSVNSCLSPGEFPRRVLSQRTASRFWLERKNFLRHRSCASRVAVQTRHPAGSRPRNVLSQKLGELDVQKYAGSRIDFRLRGSCR